MSPSRRQFPPQVVDHALRLHHRFSLGFGDIAVRLAERGIQSPPPPCGAGPETCRAPPPASSARPKRRRAEPSAWRKPRSRSAASAESSGAPSTRPARRPTSWSRSGATGRPPSASCSACRRTRTSTPSPSGSSPATRAGSPRPNDGVLDRWRHWSRSGRPTPGNVHMDLYPDVRDFRKRDLYPTGLGPFGNGKPAFVYSSYQPGHPQRALQVAGQVRHRRHLPQPLHEHQPALHRGAQHRSPGWPSAPPGAIDRHFYFKFNLHQHYTVPDPAAGIIADYIKSFEREMPDIIPSSRYAKKAGKPVVEIWGCGLPAQQRLDHQGPDAQADRLLQGAAAST